MACPQCGGADREQIAPGLWRCRANTLVEKTTWVPDLSGGRRPLVERVPSVCRAEYQEGDARAAAVCACSTFAIGICALCRLPVCGIHSRMTGEGRLCIEHAADFDKKAKVKAAERRRQRHQDGQRALAAGREYTRRWIDAFVTAMAAAGNPGASPLGGGLCGWPIGRSSTHRQYDNSWGGYTDRMTQRVLTTDGRIGDCVPHVERSPRKKKWYQRRPEPNTRADLAQPHWWVYTDFKPLDGTPSDPNLRIDLASLAQQHDVRVIEPPKPDGLRERPETGVVTYHSGGGPGDYARVENDGDWGMVRIRRPDDVQAESRPLGDGDRVSFEYYLWMGEPAARNVRRLK